MTKLKIGGVFTEIKFVKVPCPVCGNKRIIDSVEDGTKVETWDLTEVYKKPDFQVKCQRCKKEIGLRKLRTA